MGRHRRADPAPAPAPVTPTRRAAGGRHRGRHHRRNTAPVRTGLLGASAAMALGAVAVASGLIPGPNGDYIIGGPADHSGVPADALPAPHTQGTVTPPADRGLGSTTSRDDDRAASPSPSPSLRPGKPEATPPGEPAEPTPSRSSAAPAAEADTPPNPAAPRQTPSPEPTAPGGSASDAETAAEDAVLALVNSERVQGGCRPLTADPALAELAGDFSRDMAVRGFFSHTSPNGDTPWDRAEAAGIANLGGENIARGQADAQSVMDAWMDSPGHRANILNCDYRTLGVGVHFAEGGPWWTQNFGY